MKRLTLSAGILAAAQVGGQLIGFLMLAIVSRKIGPGYLGAYTFSLNLVGYVGLATTVGLPILGLREVSQSPSDRRRVLLETVTARVLLSLLLGGALVAASSWIAPSPATRALLPILASKLLIDALTLNWYLQGGGRNKIVAACEFLSQIAYAAALIPLLANGLEGARGYAIANLAGFAVAALLMLIVVARDAGRRLGRVTVARLKARITRSTPFLWWVALTQVYYSTDLILVEYIGGDRKAGLYAAASKLPLSVIGVAALWFTVSMPAVARLYARAEIGAIRQQTRLAATAAVVAGLPFILLGPLFAKDLCIAIFGARFAGSWPALAVLSASVAVSFMQIVVTSVVMGAGRERPYVRSMAFGAGANVVLNLALIPVIGIIGAAISTMVAESIVLAAGLAQMAHVIGRVHVRWRAVLDSGLIAGVVGAITLLVRHEAGFLAAAGCAMLLYGGVIGFCTLRNRRWLIAWLGSAA